MHRTLAALAATSLTLTLAACGGDDDKTASTVTVTKSASASQMPAQTVTSWPSGSASATATGEGNEWEPGPSDTSQGGQFTLAQFRSLAAADAPDDGDTDNGLDSAGAKACTQIIGTPAHVVEALGASLKVPDIQDTWGVASLDRTDSKVFADGGFSREPALSCSLGGELHINIVAPYSTRHSYEGYTEDSVAATRTPADTWVVVSYGPSSSIDPIKYLNAPDKAKSEAFVKSIASEMAPEPDMSAATASSTD